MNPWTQIPLEDYENHMRYDSVRQLQVLNKMMKGQIASCADDSIMILGVAGGNGLEYVDEQTVPLVYGIDINEAYLEACRNRYPKLSGVLQTCCLDIAAHPEILPRADHVIADLFVEYVGYEAFCKAMKAVCPQTVSCIIQQNGVNDFVSHTPYEDAFHDLDSVEHNIDPQMLISCLDQTGYIVAGQISETLPNGKILRQVDFTVKSLSAQFKSNIQSRKCVFH